MISKEVGEEVAMYSGALLAGAALFALKSFRTWAVSAYRRVTGKHSKYPETKLFQMDRNIHDFLIELRAELGSIRTSLWQFHNGQIFSSQNPVWRTSCTHESCAAGISHEIMNRQALLASNLTDLLGSMFGIVPLPPGVYAISKPQIPTIYVFDTSKMNESMWRSLLLSGGSDFACVLPVAFSGQVVAFVVAGYRGEFTPCDHNNCDSNCKLRDLDFVSIKDFASKISLEMTRAAK